MWEKMHLLVNQNPMMMMMMIDDNDDDDENINCLVCKICELKIHQELHCIVCQLENMFSLISDQTFIFQIKSISCIQFSFLYRQLEITPGQVDPGRLDPMVT